MKFENEIKIEGAMGYLRAIANLLEIEDNSRDIKENEIKIKYIREAIDDIEKVLKDEHEPSTS